MSITLLSLTSLQAVQEGISQHFPANFNATQAALGLGLGFLNITHLTTTRQMTNMAAGPTTKPVSSKSEARNMRGPVSPAALIAGVVLAVAALIAAVACVWNRYRSKKKNYVIEGGDDGTSGISFSSAYNSGASLPRTSQLDTDRAVKSDNIPRLSAAPASEWVSHRGSTLTPTSNPLNSTRDLYN